MTYVRRIAGFTIILFLLLTSMSLGLSHVDEEKNNKICLVYFTGVGCPHCAKTDPVVLEKLPKEYENLVIIEYEIYQQRDNAPLMLKYDEMYGTGKGIPLIIINETQKILGDAPILNSIENFLNSMKNNECLLLNGSASFDDLNLNDLPGYPKIWSNGRVLIKTGNGTENSGTVSLAKQLLFSTNVSGTSTEPPVVHLSGKDLKFSKAVKIGENWILTYDEISEDVETGEKSPNVLLYMVTGIIILLAVGVTLWKG